jgi:hypothetical protein
MAAAVRGGGRVGGSVGRGATDMMSEDGLALTPYVELGLGVVRGLTSVRILRV